MKNKYLPGSSGKMKKSFEKSNIGKGERGKVIAHKKSGKSQNDPIDY